MVTDLQADHVCTIAGFAGVSYGYTSIKRARMYRVSRVIGLDSGKSSLTQARAAQNVDVLGHTLATCLRAGKQSMGFSLWMTVPCWSGSTEASPLPASGTCGGMRTLSTDNLCENIRVLLCVLQHACMTCSDDCCSICQACRM